MEVAWISGAAAAVAAAASLAGMMLVRGTTAVPAAAWAVAAWSSLAGEMLIRAGGGLVDPGTAASARLAVAAVSLCPAMSLLGAKRPQHGVWQFIVATLFVVLILPVGPALVAFPGSLPGVHLLAKWFMVALSVVGWMNFIATGRGLAATLVTVGQIILMRPFLPGFTMADQIDGVIQNPSIDCAAACLAAMGTLLAAGQGWLAGALACRSEDDSGVHPLKAIIDPPFRALRETLGAAWALRVAERFDQIAAARGWPCRLSFGGLSVDGAGPDPAWQRDAWRAFAALMRRFVTVEWLRRHGGPRTAQRSGA